MFGAICLAAAIYFEARSEPLDAQAAVGGVVMERVASKHYPDTICEVVLQRKQFSAFNGGIRPVRNKTAWGTSLMVARMVIDDQHGVVPILGATHYHADYVRPYWADSYRYLGKSGKHLFYGPH